MDQPCGQAGRDDPLRGKLGVEQLDLILRSLDSLPTPASTAGRLLDLAVSVGADGPDAGMREETLELIETDPALSARLLRMANRNHAGSVRTVRQAAQELGFEAVRSAALSVGIFVTEERGRSRTSGEDEADRPAFHAHSLEVASAAQMLAEHLRPPVDPEEAFVCGLLHDLGKLALRQCLPRSYARVLEQVRIRNGDVAEYERKIIGVDHTIAGHRLARLWRLPGAIGEVIWLHHHPFEAIPQGVSHRRLVGLVALADAIARRWEGLGFSGGDTSGETCERIARRIGLDPGVIPAVAARLGEQAERRAGLGRIGRTAAAAPFGEALATANAELTRLNEQLRRRVDSLSAKADAFARLRDFNAAMTPDAPVADVLRRIAATIAGGADDVVAYAFTAGTGEVLAVRCDGSEASESRLLRLSERWSDGAAPDPGTPAAEVLAGFLDEAEALNDWVDPIGSVHQPLVCAGEWVGGLFHPAGGREPTQEDRAVGEAMAMALAAAVERSRAMRLSEQFAGASRMLAETREALAERKAMAAVGEMAAGAAHELNNPLAVVSGRAQQMSKKARSEKTRRTWLLIAEQAQRISDTISALMEFASPPQPKPSRVESSEVLRSAWKAFSSSGHPQAASARVDMSIGDNVPALWADAEQLRAVIVELLTNAANAVADGVRIRLSAEADEDAGAVLLSVTDNGPGMDADTQSRAFTPFFSAQKAGRRRGLGLSRARRTIESNGGQMWIRSRPGEGTTVTVSLPAASGA